MDKATSVLAALEAGKLPSTQQTNQFIDWLNDIGIAQVEPTAQTELSSQGRVLADDLRRVLDAYKQLGTHKNHDNILQKALWHLSQGDLTVKSEAEVEKNKALDDLNAIRGAIRNLLSIVWSSATSETTALYQDFFSIIRLSLADAAEALEGQAGAAKDSLRQIEEEVQGGSRDSLGRDKKRLEEEQDPKVAWEHGMDTVKGAGTSVIGAAQDASSTVQEKADKTSSRLEAAFNKISDRAQSDPEYRQSLDTLFEIVQTRLNTTMDAASDPNVTLSSFISDPTPEQHIPRALKLLRTLTERLANTPLEPLIQKARGCANAILRDDELKAWFDEFFAMARNNLSEAGYARSEQAQSEREDLSARWTQLLEKDDKWKAAVNGVKKELAKVLNGLQNDKELNEVKAAHAKLGADMQRGLVEAGKEAQSGVQAAVGQATWFWQDLFKVYIPRFLSKMRDLPIPRTEYKDAEVEFVLENLDVSSFNMLPSHVYIRNITDVDIQTSASASTPSRTAVGVLTHIKVQAMQMALNDVSFWYKDKEASIGPSEFTGLLAMKLPPKGIDLDLKVRLIPATTTGPGSRESTKHFSVVEHAQVSISEDVEVDVRESNHSVLLTVFRPIMIMRLKEALERTLTAQFKMMVEGADAIAYDIAMRREVFEDTGLGPGGALMAAIWSEVGKIERENREGPTELDWKATGTGVVFEQKMDVGGDVKERKSAFAMGAEPQILSGEKRGPLGTGSEKLSDKLGRAAQELGDVDMADVSIGESAKEVVGEVEARAKGIVNEGKKQIAGFRRNVERKKSAEKGRTGWESSSFDF